MGLLSPKWEPQIVPASTYFPGDRRRICNSKYNDLGKLSRHLCN